MPLPAGLLDSGLVILTQPEILASIQASQRANVSNELNQEADSLVGNFNGIVSDSVASVWELARDIYNSQFPGFAAGYSLSQLVQLTRTRRNPATYSNVTCSVNVNPGTYPAGSLVAMVNGRPDNRFSNVLEVSNPGGAAAAFDAVFRAEATGPIAAPSGSLVIAEPATGWNSISNALDAEQGKDIETDAALRLRREQELASGSTTADAIRAAILRELSDEGVTSARVLVNDGDSTDANGVLPHSIEAIVQGPESPTVDDDAALADTIRRAKADGIRAAGSTEVVTSDSQGNEIVIGFSRPVSVPIYVDLSLSVDPATYAGEAAVKDAILSAVYAPGDDVSFFRVACLPFGVAGVRDVTTGGIGTSPATGVLPIPIGIRELAAFDTSRINITLV